MAENNDKRFFDFFKNYKTDDNTRQILERAKTYADFYVGSKTSVDSIIHSVVDFS